MTYQSFVNHWPWWGYVPFGPAYKLVEVRAPWWVKMVRIRGFYWIYGGRSHWLTIGSLS